MAVARKAEIEGDIREIGARIGDAFEGRSEPEQRQVTMDRQPGLLLENACEIERRGTYGGANIVESDGLGHSRCEIGFRRFRPRRVIGICRRSPAEFGTVAFKSIFEDIGDKLQSCDISPKRLQRFDICYFQASHEFAVAPKNSGLAGASNERKRIIWSFIDPRVEFSYDVVQYRLSNDKRCAAIAAIGRVAYAINRVLAKKHYLINIRRDLSPFKMLRECTVPHQYDAIHVGLLLGRFFA